MMDYALSAGAIVVQDDALLMVHHHDEKEDFWVPPGGRLEDDETLVECARRETHEETGLWVIPDRVIYIEEFIERDLHFVKLWFHAILEGGKLTTRNRDRGEGFLVEARFVRHDEIGERTVYPSIVRHLFWEDLAAGFRETRYLGLKRI